MPCAAWIRLDGPDMDRVVPTTLTVICLVLDPAVAVTVMLRLVGSPPVPKVAVA